MAAGQGKAFWHFGIDSAIPELKHGGFGKTLLATFISLIFLDISVKIDLNVLLKCYQKALCNDLPELTLIKINYSRILILTFIHFITN